jgi:hypothetical protein
MTDAVLKKELHALIDVMPDRFVRAIMPLATCFAEEYWKPKIEPADHDEIILINERMKDYEKKPTNWISLENLE